MPPTKELLSRAAKASRLNSKYTKAFLDDEINPKDMAIIKSDLQGEMYELIKDGIDNLKKSECKKLLAICMYKSVMQD